MTPPPKRIPVSSSHGLDLLRRNARKLSFRKGRVIFREGESSDALYVIEQGSVEISALIGPHQRRVFATFGVGDYFGEIAVIDSKPRSATAIAKADTVVRRISRDKVWRMFTRAPRTVHPARFPQSTQQHRFCRRPCLCRRCNPQRKNDGECHNPQASRANGRDDRRSAGVHALLAKPRRAHGDKLPSIHRRNGGRTQAGSRAKIRCHRAENIAAPYQNPPRST